MQRNFIRKIMEMDLEEKILNGGSLLALLCVFFPWIGGEWLGGKTVTYTGLGFFTSFVGFAILLIHIFVLALTVVPLAGGKPLLARSQKDVARLLLSMLAAILTVAIWSVHTKFTFEFSRLQIHFGLYGTLIGSLVTTLYAFLRYQENRKIETRSMFGHERQEEPLPPPTLSMEPEEHRIHP